MHLLCWVRKLAICCKLMDGCKAEGAVVGKCNVTSGTPWLECERSKEQMMQKVTCICFNDCLLWNLQSGFTLVSNRLFRYVMLYKNSRC